MWASWAFCKLVHIPMPTPYLSIKKFKNSTDSHHIAGQRATRQFGDEMQEYSTNHSNLLLIEQFFRFSTLSQPRLARDAKSQFFRDVTLSQQVRNASGICPFIAECVGPHCEITELVPTF